MLNLGQMNLAADMTDDLTKGAEIVHIYKKIC